MKKSILTLIIGLFAINGIAQIDVGEVFQAGMADAKTLANPYLKPFGEMLGSSLNSGWYTSAKPHKVLGFDLTFTGTYTMAPSSAKTFDVSKLDLQSFSLAPGSSSIAPTIAGDINDLPVLRSNSDPIGVTDFEVPQGSNLDFFVTPMVTAGVGLPMGIEVKGRFSPKLKLGDAGSLSLWGLGVQKDIKDYIPGIKHVPVLNMSVLAAYTKFTSEANVGDVQGVLTNANLAVDANAFTTRLLVGANLPVLAVYTGLGYGKTSSDFVIDGDFNSIENSAIALKYKTSSFDFNVGMRLRLGVIGIHADYTVGEYSSVTAGLGINFR